MYIYNNNLNSEIGSNDYGWNSQKSWYDLGWICVRIFRAMYTAPSEEVVGNNTRKLLLGL